MRIVLFTLLASVLLIGVISYQSVQKRARQLEFDLANFPQCAVEPDQSACLAEQKVLFERIKDKTPCRYAFYIRKYDLDTCLAILSQLEGFPSDYTLQYSFEKLTDRYKITAVRGIQFSFSHNFNLSLRDYDPNTIQAPYIQALCVNGGTAVFFNLGETQRRREEILIKVRFDDTIETMSARGIKGKGFVFDNPTDALLEKFSLANKVIIQTNHGEYEIDPGNLLAVHRSVQTCSVVV